MTFASTARACLSLVLTTAVSVRQVPRDVRPSRLALEAIETPRNAAERFARAGPRSGRGARQAEATSFGAARPVRARMALVATGARSSGPDGVGHGLLKLVPINGVRQSPRAEGGTVGDELAGDEVPRPTTCRKSIDRVNVVLSSRQPSRPSTAKTR